MHDYGNKTIGRKKVIMEERMKASQFKSECLQIMDRVQIENDQILVTDIELNLLLRCMHLRSKNRGPVV